MPVRTSGRLITVKRTPRSRYSAAAQRVNASNAALEALYAAKRAALLNTPMEEMLMTCLPPRAAIEGRKPSVMRTAAR